MTGVIAAREAALAAIVDELHTLGAGDPGAAGRLDRLLDRLDDVDRDCREDKRKEGTE